jgi:hypothetical protein
MGGVPLLVEPIVPRPDARGAELTVGGAKEHAPAKPGDLRRKVHRRPDTVEIHVPHPGIDIEAPRTHLFESKRLERHGFRPSAGYGVHSYLGVASALELPDLMTARGLHDARRPVLEGARQASFEQVRRLDHVVVNRDNRVPNLARLGLGQKQLGVQHPLTVRDTPRADRRG